MGIRRLDGAEANNGLFGNRIILIITNHPPITKRVKQSSLPELPTRTQNTDAPFTAYLLPVLTDPVLRDHHLIKTLNFFFLTLTPQQLNLLSINHRNPFKIQHSKSVPH